MKASNFKLARLNAGMQMLAKLFQEKQAAAKVNKEERQARRKKRMGGWASQFASTRQIARYRQQEAYRLGLVERRALPNDPKDWLR